MIDLSTYPLWVNLTVFLCAAGIIAFAGTYLAKAADQLADKTKLGEAITGTLFLGLITALPGLVASVTAAWEGRPALAISNAIGGIAIQTTFLAFADIAYRKSNLEHAAASATNLIQTVILLGLLSLILLGLTGPDISFAHLNPFSILLFLSAIAGFWLVYNTRKTPMWKPKQTPSTVKDVPDDEHMKKKMSTLISLFIINALIVMVAGAAVAHTAGNLSDTTGMNETLAGGLLSGIATSLPELVTTVAAVRQGALTLAVGDIVGGNFFDVLFIFAADLFYLEGSIFHGTSVAIRESFITGLAIVLNLILLLGLLYRQKTGPANIGFESVLLILLYVAGFVVMSIYM
jgi:cation:H+ antiporter